MKNDKWKKKKLETLLVVTLNLRLDTILYNSKHLLQSKAKVVYLSLMIVKFIDYDYRVYVKSKVEDYASLSKFVKDTKESFEKMGIIDKNGIEFLDNFSELTLQLFIISAKELNGDKLDNEENELIRYYGGNL